MSIHIQTNYYVLFTRYSNIIGVKVCVRTMTDIGITEYEKKPLTIRVFMQLKKVIMQFKEKIMKKLMHYNIGKIVEGKWNMR